MKYLLSVLVLGLIGIACMGACATSLGVWKDDVTHDPRFQGGYQAGQVYRLTSDGAIDRVALSTAESSAVTRSDERVDSSAAAG